MALVYSETVVHSSIFFSGYRTMRNYLDWKKFFNGSIIALAPRHVTFLIISFGLIKRNVLGYCFSSLLLLQSILNLHSDWLRFKVNFLTRC